MPVHGKLGQWPKGGKIQSLSLACCWWQLGGGARRLAAIKKLGWRTVKVWVRAGITDRLGQLLAEQDDNQLHKPLTQTEQAALYQELKALMAEDAASR